MIDLSASAQGLGMDDRERSVSEDLDYQLAARYFASALEHCARLPAADQQSLLRRLPSSGDRWSSARENASKQ